MSNSNFEDVKSLKLEYLMREEMILQVQEMDFGSDLNLPEAVGDYKVCFFFF